MANSPERLGITAVLKNTDLNRTRIRTLLPGIRRRLAPYRSPEKSALNQRSGRMVYSTLEALSMLAANARPASSPR
ncbi:hypothetical protein MSEN_38720 [Mycolicibacter senuensis]|uniref:Uncharacterized protein n=1 Tax=Mycolicibacter senuensis TaxID=386913 RepID=A0A7I9XQ83_9MYCO|nr:hypothetical protein MSEN_38720 [Mycolicibacter senuensis]